MGKQCLNNTTKAMYINFFIYFYLSIYYSDVEYTIYEKGQRKIQKGSALKGL